MNQRLKNPSPNNLKDEVPVLAVENYQALTRNRDRPLPLTLRKKIQLIQLNGNIQYFFNELIKYFLPL